MGFLVLYRCSGCGREECFSFDGIPPDELEFVHAMTGLSDLISDAPWVPDCEEAVLERVTSDDEAGLL